MVAKAEETYDMYWLGYSGSNNITAKGLTQIISSKMPYL